MNPLYPTRAPEKPAPTPRPSLRRIAAVFWILSLAFLRLIPYYPIRFGLINLCILGAIALLWTLSLGLIWRQRLLRIGWLAASTVLVIFLNAPGRPENEDALRQAYTESLQSYEGTPYVWGGETRSGLDCSGLVRRGFMDANWRRGVQSANPALIRSAFDLWWRDASAKSLGEGDYSRTTFVLATSKLNNLEIYPQLRPGDIAVTESGVHTMAYLGDKTWIEADPGDWKVIKVRVPSKNVWFSQPMKLVRWEQLK